MKIRATQLSNTTTFTSAVLPAFTGDATSTAGSSALTLATVNTNVGSFGSATTVPVITVNAKGLITAVSTLTVSGGGGGGTAAAKNIGTSGNTVPVLDAANTWSAAQSFSSIAVTSTTLVSNLNVEMLGGQNSAYYLNAANFTGTLSAARLPAHTGDVTSTAGSAALALATVNANTGSFGSAAAVPIITVNGKGLITAVSTAPLGTAAAQNIGTSGATVPLLNANNTFGGFQTFTNYIAADINGNAATATKLQNLRNISTTGDATTTIAFDGSANASAAITLATVNSNTGSFGSATLVPVITVNAKGLITAVSTIAVSGGGGSGLPTGGVAKAVLTKATATDGDAVWKLPLADFPVFYGTRQGFTSGNGFTTIPYDPTLDTHSAWDNTNKVWVCPAGQGGLYRCIAKLRISDGQGAGISYGLGVHTSNADNYDFEWTSTNGVREGHKSIRIITVAPGDALRGFYYIDSGPKNLENSVMIIERIR